MGTVSLLSRGAPNLDCAIEMSWSVDPTHVFVLPPATTIAAHGFLAIEGDASTAPLHFTFGLGSADSAVLIAPNGVVVDQLSWLAPRRDHEPVPRRDRQLRVTDHRHAERRQRLRAPAVAHGMTML
jgi:hypothetical protein